MGEENKKLNESVLIEILKEASFHKTTCLNDSRLQVMWIPCVKKEKEGIEFDYRCSYSGSTICNHCDKMYLKQ